MNTAMPLEVLEDLAAQVAYKPGWTVEVEEDRPGSTHPIILRVKAVVQHPHRGRQQQATASRVLSMPQRSHVSAFYDAVRDTVQRIERDLADAFLTVGGYHVFTEGRYKAPPREEGSS